MEERSFGTVVPTDGQKKRSSKGNKGSGGSKDVSPMQSPETAVAGEGTLVLKERIRKNKKKENNSSYDQFPTTPGTPSPSAQERTNTFPSETYGEEGSATLPTATTGMVEMETLNNQQQKDKIASETAEFKPNSNYGTLGSPTNNSSNGGGGGTETIKVEISIKYPPSCRPGIGWLEMLYHLLWIAIPTLSANVFLFAAQTVTMAFVGQRLGFDALAAFSVGVSAYNICGASIGQGICNALDTLASQAFGRDHKTPELGVLLQRAMLVNTCIWIPITLLFTHSERVLQVVYGEELGSHAYIFLRATPPYLYAFYLTVSQTKIMQSQQRAYLPLCGHAIATVSCFFINHHFLHHGDSVERAVFVLTTCQLIVAGFLALMNIFHPSVITRNAQWPISPELYNRQSLEDYVRMGFSALTATCAEWWAFEFLQIVAAQVGTTEVGAFTMMLNVLILYFSVSFGIATGVATMVGNALGANQATVAKRYFILVCLVSICTTLCTASSLYFFGIDIMSLFTKEPKVLGAIDRVIHFFALYHALAATQTTLQGVFRGAGKQRRAATAAVFSLWCVGLPLAAFFCLKLKMGLFGIFLGQSIGISVLIPLFLVQILRWNWRELASLASTITFVDTEQSPGTSSRESFGSMIRGDGKGAGDGSPPSGSNDVPSEVTPLVAATGR